MRFGIFVLIFALCSGCFFKADRGAPEGTPTEAPAIGAQDAKGKILYIPSITGDIPLTDAGKADAPPTEHCKVEEVREMIGPEEIKAQIGGVYDTVSFSREAEAPLILTTADHVHLQSLEFAVAAGDSFHFLSWLKVYLHAPGEQDTQIAWGRDLDNQSYNLNLLVDGETDLVAYVQDGIRLKGSLRAKSPNGSTWIQAYVGFVVFYDCEWY